MDLDCNTTQASLYGTTHLNNNSLTLSSLISSDVLSSLDLHRSVSSPVSAGLDVRSPSLSGYPCPPLGGGGGGAPRGYTFPCIGQIPPKEEALPDDGLQAQIGGQGDDDAPSGKGGGSGEAKY